MNKSLRDLELHKAQVTIDEAEYRRILQQLQDIDALTDRLVEEKWAQAQKDGSVLIRLELHEPEYEPSQYYVRLSSAWSIPEQLEPLTQKVVYWAEDAVDRIYGEKRDYHALKVRIEELQLEVTKQFVWKCVWMGVAFLTTAFTIYQQFKH